MSVLSKPYFHDEAAAFAFVESIIWNGQPVCPHCGCTGRIGTIKPNPEKKVRMGLKKCGDCRKQFTVRVGTIFEDSHLPMTKWLQAIHLMCSSKKGVSAHQMHRTLEITYKTAWFLEHRIREAMRSGVLAPFGSNGTPVEADETFIGREPGMKKRRGGAAHKIKVLTLIDRETGRASSHVVDDLRVDTLQPIIRAAVAKEARLMTDEAHHYGIIGRDFAEHGTTKHAAGEYVRGDVHSNTVEGFFGIFKRGMRGVYQKASKKHLHRYLAEFDFRYSNRAAVGVDDQARTVKALEGVVGKRLTYRRTNERAA